MTRSLIITAAVLTTVAISFSANEAQAQRFRRQAPVQFNRVFGKPRIRMVDGVPTQDSPFGALNNNSNNNSGSNWFRRPAAPPKKRPVADFSRNQWSTNRVGLPPQYLTQPQFRFVPTPNTRPRQITPPPFTRPAYNSPTLQLPALRFNAQPTYVPRTRVHIPAIPDPGTTGVYR